MTLLLPKTYISCRKAKAEGLVEMGTATDSSHDEMEEHVPDYYEHSIWPALIAFVAGVAMTGFLLLLKGLFVFGAVLMMISFGGVLVGFLYSDTANWKAVVSKFGRIPRDTVIGAFPVDINLTVQIIILTELLLFGGAFGMYFALRSRAVLWPPPGTPVLDDFLARIQTLVLISSSILVEFAVWLLKQGRMKAFKVGIIGTTILGSMFPVLQFGFEWPHLLLNNILTPATNFFGASFYLLTGIHGAHVVAGIIAYCYTDMRALLGQYSPKNHGFVEATSTYWHFVHIIWLFLFALMWQGSRLLA